MNANSEQVYYFTYVSETSSARTDVLLFQADKIMNGV